MPLRAGRENQKPYLPLSLDQPADLELERHLLVIEAQHDNGITFCNDECREGPCSAIAPFTHVHQLPLKLQTGSKEHRFQNMTSTYTNNED